MTHEPATLIGGPRSLDCCSIPAKDVAIVTRHRDDKTVGHYHRLANVKPAVFLWAGWGK